MAGWSKKKRALHDRVSDTLVMKSAPAKKWTVAIMMFLLAALIVTQNIIKARTNVF